MPVVTKLATQKNGEYINLFIDDNFCCGISLNQVAEWRLHKGQEISPEKLDDIRRQADENRAYTAAIRYLSFRIRSSGEVRQYLKRKGFEDMSDYVIARLEQESYLDDLSFTKSWVKMRSDMNWSSRAIKHELIRKGIAKEAIESSVAGLDAHPSIRRLIAKKNRHHKYDRNKMMSYLSGKGFSYSQIKACLDELDLDQA